MKKTYVEPEFEIVMYTFENMLSGGVNHSGYEAGGQNSNWSFDGDDDDDGFGD